MMKISIDNKPIKVSSQVTILEAADENGIYIPRMCAHPELLPYGGCRLCIVEVEGIKGYPTACTTLVEDDMIIRTNTNTLQKMRLDLLQLILSEHPSACLLCEDIDGCSMFQETIRKVGVTTGCRWCPKDKDCELQRIVESFNIHEISLPGLYRDLPVEKYDPFFDRDYNLCIYCGRCVRICNEYRKSSVISLRQRGKHTTIGPSFDYDHTDAGCEYCGACVSVCPTGAMSEKSRKWWGLPDTYTKSVCPLCSINCDLQVISLRDKIVGTIPPGKPHEAAGELCVKGRFCLSEMVNRTERLLEPRYLYPEGEALIGWKEALKKAAGLVKEVKKERSAIFVSPDLSYEEYGAIAELAEKVLRTDNITSSCLDNKLISFLSLSSKSVNIDSVIDSSSIVSFFLNGNYNFAPLTLAIKNAASSGIPYHRIGWIKDTTSRFATADIVPEPDSEVKLLDDIIGSIKNKKINDAVATQIADELKKDDSIIIVGPTILSLTNIDEIIDRINTIIEITQSKLYAPFPHGNIKAMLSVLEMKPVTDVINLMKKEKIDLVYIVADIPLFERSDNYKLIYQSAFPFTEDLKTDLVLPSTIWGESAGTWPGRNGKPVKARKSAKAHDYAKSNIDIISRIASSTGNNELKESIKKRNSKIDSEMEPVIPVIKQSSAVDADNKDSKKLDFIFVREKSPHNYMNLHLDETIEGLNELVSPEYLVMNHSKARELGLKDGDEITVSDKKSRLTRPVKIRKNIPDGVIYMTHNNQNDGFKLNPCYVNIRRIHV